MQYIPIKQAAQAAHVAIKTLYRWVARGVVAYRRPHRRGIVVELGSVIKVANRTAWALPRQLGLWEVAG